MSLSGSSNQNDPFRKFKPERPSGSSNQSFPAATLAICSHCELKFGAQTRALEPYSPGSLEEEVSVAEESCSVPSNPGDLAHHLHTLSKSEALGSAEPTYVYFI